MSLSDSNTLSDTLRRFVDGSEELVGAIRAKMAYYSPAMVKNLGSLSTTTPKCFSYLLEQPTIIPKLPLEILDSVFSLLYHDQLFPLLLTNSFVYSVSIRHFYHEVSLKRPHSIIHFLRLVQANPHLAAYLRTLEININVPERIPTRNFYILLHSVLRSSTLLTSLSIDLPNSHAPLWIFSGCLFKLKMFSTNICTRRGLAEYLETQSSIVELTLKGRHSDFAFMFLDSEHPSSFALSPEALPNLRRFNASHANAFIIQTVVQNRPVEIASVPLFLDMTIASLDALLTSSKPLKRLSLMSFDPGSPPILFDVISNRFKDLEALHLVMLMTECPKEILAESGSLLSGFKRLKYLTLIASPGPAEDNPIDLESDPTSAREILRQESQIAKSWHRACPTLQTIILPKGQVWFHTPELQEALYSLADFEEDNGEE